MSSDEEGDVCRVCRLEGDADEPLIYPCKCAGSVKYVHRDCFQDWIRTSKKKHCEICGHRYTFTKVYPDYIPTVIPAIVWLRQGIRWAGRRARFILRLILVAVVWLVVLPIWTMDGIIAFIGIPNILFPELYETATSAANSTAPAFGDLDPLSANATAPEVFNAEFMRSLGDFRWTLKHDVLGVTAAIFQPRRVVLTYLSVRQAWHDETARPKILAKILAQSCSFLLCSQIFTIVLALVLILLIFLREWVTQHEWDQQHMAEHHPPPTPEEGEIDPNEWIIERGVARRKDDPEPKPGPPKSLEANWVPTKTASEEESYQSAIDRATLLQMAREMDAEQATLRAQGVPEDLKGHEARLAELKRRFIVERRVRTRQLLLRAGIAEDSVTASLGPHDGAASGQLGASSNDVQPEASGSGTNEAVKSGTVKQEPETPWSASSPLQSSPTPRPPPTQGPESPSDSPIWSLPSSPPPLFSSPAEPISRTVFQRPQHIPMPVAATFLPSALQPAQAGPSRPSPMKSPDIEFEFSPPEMLAEKGKGRAVDSVVALLKEERESPELEGTEDGEEIRFDGLDAGGIKVEQDVVTGVLSEAEASGSSARARRGAKPTPGDEEAKPPDPRSANESPGSATTVDADYAIKQETETGVDDGSIRSILHNSESEPTPAGTLDGQDPLILPAEHLVLPGDLDAGVDAVLHGPNGDDGPVVRDFNELEVDGVDEGEPDEPDEGPWEREDWDGVFEMLGLRGPLLGLVTNTVLACIVAFSASTVLFGLPILLGRVTLGMDWVDFWLEAFRALDKFVWQWAVKPVLEVGWEIVMDVVLKPAGSSFLALERIMLEALNVRWVVQETGEEIPFRMPSGMEWLRWMEYGWAKDNRNTVEPHLRYVYDHAAYVLSRGEIRLQHLYTMYREYAFELSVSHTTSDLLLCLVLGYSVLVLSLAALVLLPETVGDALVSRSIATLAGMLKRHLPFFKLGFFMTLELAAFPLGVGLAIDLATAPWFSGSWSARLVQINERPAATLFVCWLMGTLFMYSFANFLAFIRSMCRSGCLWFIRDPADPSYSAVKDIVDRPVGSQLRKLGMSAIMYGVLVYSLFGLSTTLLHLQTFSPILPLRLPDRPLSSIPFDLLFLHLAVPPSLEHLRPRHKVKKAWHTWWRYTTRQLRLAELIDGERTLAERGSAPKLWERTFWPVADVVCRLAFGQYETAASFARVPAVDQVSLLPLKQRKHGGVFVMLDKHGRPKTEEGKLRLLRQDRLARNNGRDPATDYRVLWLPRFWRTRVHVFSGCALLTAGAGIAAGALGPLIVGRGAMDVLLHEEVHDGYSYILGAYITYATYLLAGWTRQKITFLGYAERIRRSSVSTRIKRSIFNRLCDVYALTLLYLVLPVLVGLNIELYYGLAIRYDFRSVPVVHLWDVWALGTLVDAILVTAVSFVVHQRRRRRGRSANRLTTLERLRGYLRSPLRKNVYSFTATMIPTFAWLVLGIVVPNCATAVVTLAARLLMDYGLIVSDDPDATLELIPGVTFLSIIIAMMLLLSRRFVKNRYKGLRQRVIDAEYIVEERPENYVPESKTERAQAAKGVQVKVLDGQGLNGRPEANGVVGQALDGADDAEGAWEDVEDDVDVDAEERDDLDRILEQEEAAERRQQDQEGQEIGMGGGLTESGGESDTPDVEEMEDE